MILDPHNRPTLEDILGSQFPIDGAGYINDDGMLMFAIGDDVEVDKDIWTVIDRDDFLRKIAEGDIIVAAILSEWDQRFGDGPQPSPMNEYPDDPLLGVKTAVIANPRA
jgi:aldehyde:ferredoxin oxidoreductase